MRLVFALGAVASACQLAGAVSSKDTCATLSTCEACLAEGSGCHGWFGSSCCSKDECLSALAGDRSFHTSCEDWQHSQQRWQVCSAVPANDACACIKAGCVAQEVGAPGASACFDSFKPAAGRSIERDAACENNLGEDLEVEEAKYGSQDLHAEVSASPWCEDSPAQLCRMACRQRPECPQRQCAMRRGRCCDFECQPLEES